MKTVTTLLLLSFLPHAYGGLKETVAYIESLLGQGKKIAVLVLDMQEDFRADFPGRQIGTPLDPSVGAWERTIDIDHIIGQEAKLISHLAPKEGVYIINVTYEDAGSTLPELLFQMRKSQVLKRFVKSENNAFKEIAVPDSISRQEPGELISGKLEDLLTQEGIENLFLTGCFEGACIMDTAVGALEKGFSVILDHEMNIPIRKSVLLGYPEDEYRTDSEELWQRLEQTYPKLTIVRENREGSCCTIL